MFDRKFMNTFAHLLGHFQDQGFDENDETEDLRTAVLMKRGKVSEYEITLLWQTFKDNNFPGGRVNKMQLHQILRKASTRSQIMDEK